MATSLLAIGAGVPVFVKPQVDYLRKADAIYILGGYGWDRYKFGFGLGKAGWAPNVVISNPNGHWWLSEVCNTPHDKVTYWCVDPEPPTTLGEARELNRLAVNQRWETIIVVTFTPHISRARYILERCFRGNLVMVASPAEIPLTKWVYEYVYQTAGYLRTIVDPGC